MEQEVRIIQKVNDVLVPSVKRHRIIYGGRGKGASWSIARILLLQGMRKTMFYPCIREVQKTLKDSVKKILDDTIKLFGWQRFYNSKQTEIVGRNDTRFVFHGMQEYNADNIKSLEGADGCWVAEAQTLSRRSINTLRPTIRKDGSVMWWDFNPRFETDPMWIDYILNADPNAEVLFLSHEDNPWFTKALRLEMESDYRRNKEEADHIWRGTLRNMGDLYVCPSQLVDVARRSEISEFTGREIEQIGADIAHQGGDKIVFYRRRGLKTIDAYKSQYQDTPTTVRHLKAFTRDKSVKINIDNGSIGAAVADYMAEDGWHVNRINFGGTPYDDGHYQDVVTEMYFDLRDKLELCDIPQDEELRAQLIQRKYMYIGGRRGYEVVKIEPKDKFQEHATTNSHSPDEADALVLCYYEPQGAEVHAMTLDVL